jgi:hypothetical protein
VGTSGSFLDKKWLGREEDTSPPSGAKVRMVDLYIYSTTRLHGLVLNC